MATNFLRSYLSLLYVSFEVTGGSKGQVEQACKPRSSHPPLNGASLVSPKKRLLTFYPGTRGKDLPVGVGGAEYHSNIPHLGCPVRSAQAKYYLDGSALPRVSST